MPRFAISDIHGCPKTFIRLLEEIRLTRKDELFLLGDFVNRGPDSLGVIDHIWALQKEGYQVSCSRGNHEQMWLGGTRTGLSPEDPRTQKVLDWMDGLPYFLESPGFLLVHAGFNFRAPDPLSDFRSMIWERYWQNDINYAWLGDRMIVHGHTPEPLHAIKLGIRQMEKRRWVCIDSGCTHPPENGFGYLTALNLDTGAGHHIPNIDGLA
jgi:serine/threonine protein phosphatase 1